MAFREVAMVSFRGSFCVLVVLGVFQPSFGEGPQAVRDSAWALLLARNPEAADDPSIGWRERLILNVLTPEQVSWRPATLASTITPTAPLSCR